jgi:hypothetical protein
MKKIVLPVIVVSFVVITAGSAAAFWGAKKTEKAPVHAAPPAAAGPAFNDSRRQEAKAREILIARDWMLYLTSVDGNKVMMDTDVVMFSDGKFSSRNFSTRGYAPSNFTITVGAEGLISWEVTQAADNGDIACWKGQLRDDVMRGIVSLNTLKGQLQDFYFSNTAPEKKPESKLSEERRKR